MLHLKYFSQTISTFYFNNKHLMTTKDCCKAETKKSLLPLYILLGSIFLLSLALAYIFPANTFMMYLMGVWFLSF